MSTKNFTNPNGFNFRYDFNTWSYYGTAAGGNSVKMMTSSKINRELFPEFDPDGQILKSTAKKRGISEKELDLEWKLNRKKSLQFGDKVHSALEYAFKNGRLITPTGSDEEADVVRQANSVIKYIFNNCENIEVEKHIGESDAMLAGRLDIMFRTKKNGEIWLCDWKTTGNMNKENSFKSFAYAPIDEVPNTNYGKYSLQLNLFEHILKSGGYVEKDRPVHKCIFNVRNDGVKKINVKDMDDTIESIVEWRKKELDIESKKELDIDSWFE